MIRTSPRIRRFSLLLGLITVSVAQASRGLDLAALPGNIDAEFWQLGLTFPASQSPLLDETGALCQLGQRGGVWYLYGTFGGGPVVRSCSLPTDRLVVFPVYNWINIAAPGDSAKTLREQLVPLVQAADLLEATLDGAPLPIKRLISRVFSVTLPDDNIFGVAAGIYAPAVADGYWVILPPLSAGPHELHFRAHAFVFGGDLNQDTTYHLDAVKPGPILP